MIYELKDIVDQLDNLNIKKGDTVLIRASLRNIGYYNHSFKKSDFVIEALLSAVGSEGTILGLSFTKSFIHPPKKPDFIFDRYTESNSGGLANAMINWPDSVRSRHPLNSFVGIGKNADYILKDHNENSTCFHPIKKLLELKAKLLLIGCTSESPGFSTVHLAQDNLGLSTKTIFKLLPKAFYYDSERNIKLFKKRDIPGCSKGFSNFYSEYVKEGKLWAGYVGDAYSVSIRAQDAYDIEYKLLKKNPRFALCDNPECIFCRGSLFYNISDWPFFYPRFFWKKLKKIFC